MRVANAISLLASVSNFLPTMAQNKTLTESVTKDGFCKNMSELESHMGKSLKDLFDYSEDVDYKCKCVDTPAFIQTSFTIECAFNYDDNGETFVNSERMVFDLSQGGTYELSQTSWADTYYGSSDSMEVYQVEDGSVTSCSANVCVSCNVCDDKKSIASDCSNLGDLKYTIECSDEYTGAFANSFDFGTIAASNDVGFSMREMSWLAPMTLVSALAYFA
mmetsp:Transcript_14989/g.25613  ORF Transcript_14989/g.25613 Transcript_14989/m.25613 type:complete len:219 (+) Transcript_14989:113-769(+)